MVYCIYLHYLSPFSISIFKFSLSSQSYWILIANFIFLIFTEPDFGFINQIVLFFYYLFFTLLNYTCLPLNNLLASGVS